jgi:predicted phosphohydrolase
MTTRKLLVQIVSDIHLELTKSIPKIAPKAPYLFLAGDISRPNHSSFLEFLTYCNANWSKTFYVLGNHDYWDNSSFLQQIKENVKKIISDNKLTNISILDNTFVSLTPELIVFGSTFWTKTTFTERDATMYVNDYNMIRYCDIDNLTPQIDYIVPRTMNILHNKDYESIDRFLNNDELTKDKKVIIITHFPPQRSGTSHPKYINQHPNVAEYFSHPDGTIRSFVSINNIVCWISGHTHYSYDFKSHEGIRLISNQMGYTREAMTRESGFRDDCLFEIDY